MPLSIDDFESGQVPQESVPKQVVTFLYENRDKAFTRSEIATSIDADPNVVGTALSRLKNRALVRHRGNYWALTDDLDRVVAAYDLHTSSERLDESDGGIDADAWQEASPDQPHPSEQASDEEN
jgi:predicted transcriptional regulator with HTH domain